MSDNMLPGMVPCCILLCSCCILRCSCCILCCGRPCCMVCCRAGGNRWWGLVFGTASFMHVTEKHGCCMYTIHSSLVCECGHTCIYVHVSIHTSMHMSTHISTPMSAHTGRHLHDGVHVKKALWINDVVKTAYQRLYHPLPDANLSSRHARRTVD